MVVATSVQPNNLAKILRKLDAGMFGVQFVDCLANGQRNLLKKRIIDERCKIVERKLRKRVSG